MQREKRTDPARIVLDTNVFVSGIISGKNAPGIILKAFQKGKIKLLISDEVLDEYLRVLSYPKIRRYPKVTDEYVAHVCALLIHESERVEIHSHFELSGDADDNKFLELAVDGAASMIVSGDKKDLLALKEVENIPIVLAKNCVELLKLRK